VTRPDQAVASHESATVNLRGMLTGAAKHFEPPPDVMISEWAIRNRILPRGTTSRPGPFEPEAFQIEMMDCILGP
jgi:phage terminase large subunit GpA-like protein